MSEDAYTFLRDLFVNGTRYNPGDKISVEELSRELGVSRTPLWSAINRLEAEGIVEIAPRLGVYLIEYDPERVLDIYVAREALEGMAARLAAENATDRQLALLKTNLTQQKQHLKRRELDDYHAAAVNFHEQLARAAHSVTLERLLATIFAQIRAMRTQRKNSPPMHLPHSCDDHEKLLSAIEKRDSDRAELIARAHIRDLTSQVRGQIVPPQTASRRRNASEPQSNSSG
ncbi:GntR family transcriptional regulator [Bradyrhizobium sp. NP1]|uniref:GntR family transcriptional regulator n=1 Tax=Bradyrhizobium sp. NP1 TaxID=3049772 RepID=UPI0025A6644D|nr:GntR family transcriptional regulator [Bradyrhizobium sp. NP1]WJR76848.1 GntR family transcriptional regulator [Bradyrhizobium sp. NP1]